MDGLFKKCFLCKKKTIITRGKICKCLNFYCCRCNIKHECSFDYKKSNIEYLKKHLLKIELEKIGKV